MSSDPPLHVALGPDLRRPSVRLLKLIQHGLGNRTNTPRVDGTALSVCFGVLENR